MKSTNKAKIKVVTITGGGGGFMLLSELRNRRVEIKSIVNVADDGGSTGVLRKELRIVPPGDIRQCIVALSDLPVEIVKSLNYRFKKGILSGHTVGNILIAGLEKNFQDFNEVIVVMSKIFNLKGEVIPASLKATELRVQLKNKEILKGENFINKSEKLFKKGIEKIYLNKNNQPNKKAVKAIKEADLIILGPGNLYCSLIPNLLVEGFSEAIRESKAKLFYVANLINKKGHTDNFSVKDYVDVVNGVLGENRIDFVLANNIIKKKDFVRNNFKENTFLSCEIIEGNFLSSKKMVYGKTDSISKFRSSFLHNNKTLLDAIFKKYNKI